MTRQEIKQKVLKCIDEVNEVSSTNIGLSYPIDEMLDQAAEQLLLIAPLYVISSVADFSTTKPRPNEDGSGEVALPNMFLRIRSFKMCGWRRDAKIHHFGSVEDYRQHNKYSRGGTYNPVVIIDGNMLRYYSVDGDNEHAIERAEAIVSIPVGETYPERLIIPLAWLAASKVLQVMNEANAAKVAYDQFNELLKAL